MLDKIFSLWYNVYIKKNGDRTMEEQEVKQLLELLNKAIMYRQIVGIDKYDQHMTFYDTVEYSPNAKTIKLK